MELPATISVPLTKSRLVILLIRSFRTLYGHKQIQLLGQTAWPGDIQTASPIYGVALAENSDMAELREDDWFMELVENK